MVDDDSAHSTPNSSSAQQHQLKAAKDRSCPFCGQAFTSSSLGRHLDLYIKPKNPKPPDGVHDVEEIKKLRGNITRRQPRTSGKGAGDGGRNNSVVREDSVDESYHRGSHRSTQYESMAAEDSPLVSPVYHKATHESTGGVNTMNWQATGVINNLPPRAPSRGDEALPTGQAQRIQEMRRDAGGNRIQRPEPESESMYKLQQDAELGRAAEMALREVLGSLEAAQKRVEPKMLFDDFDFYSLSFPGLCLAILPPPSTLFSPTPFPSADSWTLGPPGLRQYEAMNRYLNEAITNKRKVETVSDSVAFKHHAHLSGAWEHWQIMSENDRASAWTLETLRSFSRVQDQKKRLRSDLEDSQQHVRHLEIEYDRLSRCQLPREYLMHPPNTIPVAPSVMRELQPSQMKSGIADTGYDAEALLARWKSTIRATQRPSRLQKQTSGSSSDIYTERNENHIRDSMVMNGAIWNVGGPVPRHREPHTENIERHGEIQSVSYETPPNPGGVITAADDDGEAGVDEDADGDADEASMGEYNAQLALIRRQRGINDRPASGGEGERGLMSVLNANGKRQYTQSPGTIGRAGGTKLYKAHDDGD